jgi:hypothetical protein
MEYDAIGVLAAGVAYCIGCAQEVFGFDVVTAIFEEEKQGTFFSSIKERDLKVMLFPVCSTCGGFLGQDQECGC